MQVDQIIDYYGVHIKDCPRGVTGEERSYLKTVKHKLALKTRGKAGYKSVACMPEYSW